MTDSPIEWLQNPDGSEGKSWNPVRGCSRVSPGCDFCYAMRQAHRFSGAGGTYEGLTTIRKGKVDWSGEARFVPEMLDAPLRWRKPQRVFVNSMSDLFHHSVTFEQIAAVFGVMAACPQHTFMVLTKRPERAVEFFAWLDEQARGLPSLVGARPSPGEFAQSAAVLMFADQAMDFRFSRNIDERSVRIFVETTRRPWPLPNVHLGVSVESQPYVSRIAELLKCPAAVHWVSLEPLLGEVDVSPWLRGSTSHHISLDVVGALRNGSFDGLCDGEGRPLSRAEAKVELEKLRDSGVKVIPTDSGCEWFDDQRGCPGHRNASLDWGVIGFESGGGARPGDLRWARKLVAQFRAANKPCFVKQFGRFPVDSDREFGTFAPEDARSKVAAKALGTFTPPNLVLLKNSKGSDLTEVPGDWPREYPRSE